MAIGTRLHPCLLLQKAGIPCVIWFEDALAFYGVPTGVFSLYLLVSDHEQAGQILAQHGWTDASEPPESLTHFLLWHPEIPRRRLNPPPLKAASPSLFPLVSTVLLPAADWNFPASELVWAAADNRFYPSLSTLIDCLISKLLDAPHRSRLQDTMAMYLMYLYDHVESLKHRSFIEKISYENRRLHSDAVAGLPVGTLPMIEHERQVRDQLRSEKSEGTSIMQC